MPIATITRLLIWNKNQTPGERLRELADIADENPDRYKRMILMYHDEVDEFNYNDYGAMTLSDFLGLIELVKFHAMGMAR